MKVRAIVSVLLVGALGLGAVACGDDGNDEATASPTRADPGGIPANLTTITVSDNRFTPGNLQIPAGANVTWEWTGRNPHQVSGTFNGQEVLSPKLTGSGTFVFNFATAGTFEYSCTVHGEAMKGTVTAR